MADREVRPTFTRRVLMGAVLVFALSAGVSAQAQTTEGWASASDNYTNGPIGGDWNPAITGTPTNWPDNFNGAASSTGGYIVVITNNGTCNYAVNPAGDPDYTNTINDLILGGTGNGVGGGGIANTFNMSGGSLTLVDPAGPSFAVGGDSSGGKAGGASTNFFTMTGGMFVATNAVANTSGGCLVGYGTNSTGTANFNGGTAILSDLVIGGHGTGIVNVNGGNVIITGTDTNGIRPISFDTLASGNGTLNIISGTLSATNGQVDLGHANITKLVSTINVSGGTFNIGHIQYGTGNGTAATNIVNLSGGTINFGSGISRNGTTESNFFMMSGGTISCEPGSNPSLAGGLTHWIATTSPGPGVVTFAPLSGQSITFNDVSGAGSINIAGPGTTIEAAASMYTGSTTVSGGIYSLSTAGSIVGPIVIAGNATFDVSEQAAAYTLGSGQTLSNSSSTAMIDGSLNTGSGILSLLYASGTPSLTMTTNSSANTNAALATLTLSANTTFKINNTGSALAAGSYLIISTNSEGAAVAGVPPGTVTVSGGGIQAGDTASLSIGSDSQLYLVVAARPPPPVIGFEFPMPYTNLFTLYASSSPSFSIQASSSAPINYQWYTNGVGVAGATSASLRLSNIHAGSLATYCVVSNFVGSITSMVWAASVIPPPAAYPSSVLALNPIGYWRLNDANLDGADNGIGDDGYIADDYAGGNDGIYTNVTLGYTGYNQSQDSSDSSVLLGETVGPPYVNSLAGQVQNIDFATGNGTNAEFTVEAWANGFPNAQVTGGAVVTKGVYNSDDEFNLGMDSASTRHYRFYVRSASGTVYTADSTFAPDGNWHHLAGVCDETNGKISLFIDGQLAASASIPSGSGEYETAAPMTIGAAITNNSAQGYTLQFYGSINDVAVFNSALNANQIAGQYANGVNVGPFFTQAPPATASVGAGGTLVISPVTAIGTPPVSYEWYDVNGNPISGASGSTNALPLNASLNYGSVPPDSGQLKLTVSNNYGTTNVFVTLSVAGAPVITSNLPVQVTIGQGQTYTYTVGAVASASVPLYYQWFEGGTAIANQTNAILAANAAGTYYVILTNSYGSATSVVSTLTMLPPIGNSPYATNILGLNPVGYWPMHEVEAPAPGDTETNYGSLGLLGTGFYADWAAPAVAGGIIHNVPGALAENFDTAVAFPGEPAAGDFVNCMSIPHSSPLTTLNPPFSVECWFYPSNDDTGDIWAQCGYEGLNSGSYGAGQGSIAGIRLFWNGPSFYLYTYYTASSLHQVGHIHELPDSWYHLVVTCDANTNMALYVDGVLAFTNHQAGLYAPDFWTPVTLANGKGYQNSMPGNMDEFAIYTNPLAASDIAQHYTDGTGANPAQYVADVANGNPVIYLRMNSPAYVPTSVTTLPVLVNYGSAGTNGVYSAGTAPGLINGPAYGGFPTRGLSGTNVAELSGVSSWADAGYAAAYNPIGSNAFSVTAMFRGNPGDDRNQTLVGHTTSSWRLWMNTTGNLEWQIGGTTLTSLGNYNDGDWHQVVAVYSPASNSALTGTNLLYVDGALDTSVSTVSSNGIVGSTADVLIGSDTQYTNSPAGLGQQFAGEICEVALFTNEVTPAQVQQLSSADQTAPYIDGQPVTGRSVYGGPGSYIYFGVDAGGTPTLGYQWYFNTSQTYAGATALVNGTHYSGSSTFETTVTNLTGADSGFYYVVVTNNIGSVTSILASLTVTVNPNPTNLVVSAAANNELTLSWPADHTGWELELQTNSLASGLGTNWVPMTNSTNLDQIVIPINAGNGCVFYRLVYPPQ